MISRTSLPKFRVLNTTIDVKVGSSSTKRFTHSSTPAPVPGAPHAIVYPEDLCVGFLVKRRLAAQEGQSVVLSKALGSGDDCPAAAVKRVYRYVVTAQ